MQLVSASEQTKNATFVTFFIWCTKWVKDYTLLVMR